MDAPSVKNLHAYVHVVYWYKELQAQSPCSIHMKCGEDTCHNSVSEKLYEDFYKADMKIYSISSKSFTWERKGIYNTYIYKVYKKHIAILFLWHGSTANFNLSSVSSHRHKELLESLKENK